MDLSVSSYIDKLSASQHYSQSEANPAPISGHVRLDDQQGYYLGQSNGTANISPNAKSGVFTYDTGTPYLGDVTAEVKVTLSSDAPGTIVLSLVGLPGGDVSVTYKENGGWVSTSDYLEKFPISPSGPVTVDCSAGPINDYSSLGLGSGSLNWNFSSADDATINPTALNWSAGSSGGADFSYQVTGSLQQSTTIAAYWATGPAISNIIGSLAKPIFSTAINPEPAGTYGPISIPQANLASPPITANDLLLVADPNNVIEDPSKVMALDRGPEVVNVVTHGFNPYESWAEFLQPWDLLQTELDGPANTGPALAGRVATYRPQWDSTSGWAGELVSTIASYLLPAPYSSLARVTSALFAAQAAALAEEAAEDIDQYIIDPANGYLTAPGAGQVIDLIGHSRGAAVNARVSQLLTAQGYNVAQYISLDGYSTDWPPPSNTFGDISIVGTATATRKVNYEVEQGLGSEAGHAGYSALLSLLGDITGKSLASDEINQLLNVALNWQAPDRAGFENYVIPGSHVSGDPNYWSNHTDITSLYSVLGYG